VRRLSLRCSNLTEKNRVLWPEWTFGRPCLSLIFPAVYAEKHTPEKFSERPFAGKMVRRRFLRPVFPAKWVREDFSGLFGRQNTREKISPGQNPGKMAFGNLFQGAVTPLLAFWNLFRDAIKALAGLRNPGEYDYTRPSDFQTLRRPIFTILLALRNRRKRAITMPSAFGNVPRYACTSNADFLNLRQTKTTPNSPF